MMIEVMIYFILGWLIGIGILYLMHLRRCKQDRKELKSYYEILNKHLEEKQKESEALYKKDPKLAIQIANMRLQAALEGYHEK